MKWGSFTEAFNKPGSRNIRLALSLLFIMLATVVFMTIFSVAKVFLDPDISVWETHAYSIAFAGIVAPVVALFVLLRFERLYGKISEENEERKRAEKALQESEAMLRQIIDTSPIPMVVYREEENYHINKKFIEAFGYTKEDIPTIDEWWPLAYPDKAYREFVKNRWYAAVEDAVKNKTSMAPQEVTVTCKDGSKKDVLAFFSSIGDMNLAILQDITQRKRAEGALRKLSRVTEDSPAIVVITDLDGNIEYVNPKFTQVTGYTFEEVKGKNPRILKSGHTSQEGYKLLWETILSGKEWRGEFLNKKKNGDLYWESAIISSIVDANDKITNFFAIKEDITERKRAEEELREAKKQADLYLDLMGHDINNMNQIALGYLELAVEMVKDDEVKEIIKKPLDAIQNSSKLIENVRKLQKVKTGGLKTEVIDLGSLLVELKDQYLNVPGKDVAIKYVPRRDCYVMANGLLRDVFSNLIGNAIKHSGHSKSVWIGLGLERVGEDGRDYCKVVVEDDGPGIPDVQKEKMFERFRKENAKAGGKGLGLYLVKSLVEDFHGRVHVEDRVPGDHTKGARFVVMLPAVEK